MDIEQEIYDNDIELVTRYFKSNRIKGLYCDGVIALNQTLETTVERNCILAEELGHHKTSVGNIICQDSVVNIKQEKRARDWAIEKLIPHDGFKKAYKNGCRNIFEVADYLDVTVDFLFDSLQHYREKYAYYDSMYIAEEQAEYRYRRDDE